MVEFKIGDLVRVSRQPDGLPAQIVGEVGEIDEINETHVSFYGIHIDGSMSGAGRVPMCCLEPENSREWKDALAKRKAAVDADWAAWKVRQVEWQSCIRRLADRHTITTEAVLDIWDTLEELQARYQEDAACR